MSPDLLEAYRRTYRIRRVEEELSRRYHPNPDKSLSPTRVPIHLSVGQECISVGVAMAIEDAGLERHVWINHRGHAPYLAFGGDLQRMLDELHGRATGCSGGRAGSMHLHDEAAGVMGGSPIVGSSVSLATGSAWAAKLEGSQRLTVVFCGDAVPETGQFWESLNFASLHGLRLLYVIEDNDVATATPKSVRRGGLWDQLTYHDHPEHLRFATPFASLDDFEEVYEATVELLRESGPAVLTVPTRRCCAHVGPEIDYEMLKQRDPISDLRADILRGGPYTTTTYTYDGASAAGLVERTVNDDIGRAFERAAAAPWPEVGT